MIYYWNIIERKIEDKASGKDLTSFADNKETKEETAGKVSNQGTVVTVEETETFSNRFRIVRWIDTVVCVFVPS